MQLDWDTLARWDITFGILGGIVLVFTFLRWLIRNVRSNRFAKLVAWAITGKPDEKTLVSAMSYVGKLIFAALVWALIGAIIAIVCIGFLTGISLAFGVKPSNTTRVMLQYGIMAAILGAIFRGIVWPISEYFWKLLRGIRVVETNSIEINWQLIGHAQQVIAMTSLGGKLFVVTDNNTPWIREPIHNDIPWQILEPVRNSDIVIIAVASISNKQLFAATKKDQLWVCDPFSPTVSWEHIGHAQQVVVMTSLNEKLLVVTQDNKLWMRDVIYRDISWEPITRFPEYIRPIAMVALDEERILISTRDSKIWMCKPFSPEFSLTCIEQSNLDDRVIVGMAIVEGQLYAATKNDQLLWSGISI